MIAVGSFDNSNYMPNEKGHSQGFAKLIRVVNRLFSPKILLIPYTAKLKFIRTLQKNGRLKHIIRFTIRLKLIKFFLTQAVLSYLVDGQKGRVHYLLWQSMI